MHISYCSSRNTEQISCKQDFSVIFKKLFFAKTPRELMEQLKKLQAENPTEVSVLDESAAAKRNQPSDDNKQGE